MEFESVNTYANLAVDCNEFWILIIARFEANWKAGAKEGDLTNSFWYRVIKLGDIWYYLSVNSPVWWFIPYSHRLQNLRNFDDFLHGNLMAWHSADVRSVIVSYLVIFLQKGFKKAIKLSLTRVFFNLYDFNMRVLLLACFYYIDKCYFE